MYKKEELLTLFVISLALVAASVLIYMWKSPEIIGNAELTNFSILIAIISLLILVGIAVIIGAIITVHRLQNEVEKHKDAAALTKSILAKHPNMNIVNYVMTARMNNFSDEQIIKKLKEEGWEIKDIKKYL